MRNSIKSYNFFLFFVVHRSCIMDMCECPNKMCYCESLTAYVYECQRLGINIGNWRDVVQCPADWVKHRDKLQPLKEFKPFFKHKLSWKNSSFGPTRPTRKPAWQRLHKRIDKSRTRGASERPPPPILI